jgi:hypothetical protein
VLPLGAAARALEASGFEEERERAAAAGAALILVTIAATLVTMASPVRATAMLSLAEYVDHY